MKIGKRLLAAVGAAVILGAVVSSATAGRLSTSGNSLNASWTSLRLSGGIIGSVDCEVILNSTLHSRTLTKTRGLLIGYVTAGNVTRCARGGKTILRETLPWHIQYDSFAGALPTISSIRFNVINFAFRIREPTFGIECLVRSVASEPVTFTPNISGGVIQSMTVGGSIRCGMLGTADLSGTSSSITRITVTLI
jgi:hypothetical protein